MYYKQVLFGLTVLQPLLAAGAATPVRNPSPVRARSSPVSSPQPSPFTDFNDYIFFYPAANAVQWHTLYARSLQLADDSLLMTWENYPAEPPLVNHPIFRSTDGGASWTNYSAVKDTQNGWGMRFQPFLYTMTQSLGGYPAGTILAAGVSAPFNLSQEYIDLYASTDNAKTWNFVSHVAYGAGPEDITDGHKAIWEPFILTYNNQLVIYFSDQRDSAYGQKLVHVTSSDLKTWSTAVNDVTYPTYTDRPGMAVVAHIESTNQWIMTYEYCGTGKCQAHYKVASSPLTFGSATGIGIVSNDSSATIPVGSPYIIWTQNPNKTDGSGILIASGGSQEPVFVNDDSAGATGWKMVDVGQWSAYSRSLRIIDVLGKKKLLFGNGGNMGNPDYNSVACGVTEIPF